MIDIEYKLKSLYWETLRDYAIKTGDKDTVFLITVIENKVNELASYRGLVEND